jgi:hypothetical protein
MTSLVQRELKTKQRLIRALLFILVPGYLILAVLLFLAVGSLTNPVIYFYPVNSDIYHRSIPTESYIEFAKIFISISNEFTSNNIDEKISLLPNFYCDDVSNNYYEEHLKPVKLIKSRKTRQWVSDINVTIERKASVANLKVSFVRYSTYSTGRPTRFKINSFIKITALKDNMGKPRLCIRQNLRIK